LQVRFEQGIEMLSIFKGFPSKTSILDDFQFYENRQQALQEKRARQHAQQQQEQLWQVDWQSLECLIDILEYKKIRFFEPGHFDSASDTSSYICSSACICYTSLYP